MHNLQSYNVSAQIQLIKSSAQLSNAVSAQALKTAANIWTKHVSRYDHERDAGDIISIRQQLALIIMQVNNRLTRINPLVWSELHKLDQALDSALSARINLEPNPYPTTAANDDSTLDEVSNA